MQIIQNILSKSIFINSILYPIIFSIGFLVLYIKSKPNNFIHKLLEINNLVFAFFIILGIFYFLFIYYSHIPEETIYFNSYLNHWLGYIYLIGVVLSQFFWVKFFRTTFGLPFIIFLISTISLFIYPPTYFIEYESNDIKTYRGLQLSFYVENILLPIAFYLLIFYVFWKLYIK